MTEDYARKYCKKCRFRTLKINKENMKAEHFCIEANCFICWLTKCPMANNVK